MNALIYLLPIFIFTTSSIHPATIKNKEKTKKVTFFNSLFDNFHAVEKDAFYRSAQLPSHKLGHYIRRFGIKTLVNLRGAQPESKWWPKEKKIAQKHDVSYYNIRMNSGLLPQKKDVLKLLSIYNHAPRPILIHCAGGADRTGEASALWVMEQQKKPKNVALKQLTFKYRHI